MSYEGPLSGRCSCGRNRYTIDIPPNTSLTQHAHVFFSANSTHRRAHGTPLSSFLRIPLSWYHSTTHSLTPSTDETHPAIRRIYESSETASEVSALRYFCGFCGTPLGYWTETPAERGDVIDVTLGTLSSGDLRALEEWGLVGEDVVVINGGEAERGHLRMAEEGAEVQRRDYEGHSGLSWFNDLVDGSRLGKTKRAGERRGGPGWRVEWEIVEWLEGDDENTSGHGVAGGKRKIGEVEKEDTSMQD